MSRANFTSWWFDPNAQKKSLALAIVVPATFVSLKNYNIINLYKPLKMPLKLNNKKNNNVRQLT